MGHSAVPTGGGAVGGYQAILMAPPPAGRNGAPAAHGYYRAGSDHRKDGQAVGW
jgi:gamma-glutamyltranspeptidase/glutathione hydrolase